MYRPRLLASRLRTLLANFPAVVLGGARQVGKSTLLQHMFGEEATIVVFDSVMDVGEARSEPDLFLDTHPPLLVLDEIQYAPELVAALKRRIDRDRKPGLYILTGSQQWEVLKNLSESLAGRVAFLDLEGFSLAEIALAVREDQNQRSWLEAWLDSPQEFLVSPPQRLSPDRSLYERLWRGFLPEADQVEESVVATFHQAYQRTYIERDARLMREVEDWQLFGKFFRMVGALTAQEINFTQLGREIGLSPRTAGRWLEILVATYQWHEVPAYSGNTLKRIAKKPKGYMSDSGTVCASLRISTPRALSDHPSKGAIFETAAVAEIRKLIQKIPSSPLLHHWRTHAGAEVDLILERDGILFPIEIKSTSHPSKRDCRGIQRFRETYPQQRIAPGIVLAPCEEVQHFPSGDVALPWDLDLLEG